jgi:hypothetical protein
MARRNRSEPDLFSVDPSEYLPLMLSAMEWPSGGRFPINHLTATVRQHVRNDLVASPSPLVVTGFSSIVELIELCSTIRLDDDTRARHLGTPVRTHSTSSHNRDHTPTT